MFYQIGQRWSYRTREQDPGSTLLIGKVQRRLGKPTIIHVMVDWISWPNSTEPIVIPHMAFSKKAIDASVLELFDTRVPLNAEFEDAFDTWKAQKGKVFNLTVARAIDALETEAATAVDALFDAIVTELETLTERQFERSEELVVELYRQLFSLERWFFLCDPNYPDTPIEWIFSDRTMYLTPAILAFTSRERAVSAAVSLGIYQEGSWVYVLSVPVENTVRWLSSKLERPTNWVWFNLTQKSFPLHCDDAVSLFENR